MKNSNDTIGNRIRDLLICRAVPQPTALPRAPHKLHIFPNPVGYSKLFVKVLWQPMLSSLGTNLNLPLYRFSNKHGIKAAEFNFYLKRN